MRKADPVTRKEFETLQHQLATVMGSLVRAHEKLIELEADMGAANIGAKKSALILPDHIKAN